MLKLGFDLGGTKTEAVLLSESGEVLARQRQPIPVADGAQAKATTASLASLWERAAGAVLLLTADCARARTVLPANGAMSRWTSMGQAAGVVRRDALKPIL
jgi:predicted NBD/HSP70 family sugar kinase